MKASMHYTGSWAGRVGLVGSLCLIACKSAPPPAPPPTPAPLPPPLSDPDNEMVRQKLRVAPLEATFSGVRGQSQDDTPVGIKNITRQPIQITTVRVVGPDADTFSLQRVPGLPRYLGPDKQMDLSIQFAPTADARVGVHRATLQVLTGPREEYGPPVDISALILADGPAAESEPPLKHVVQALGYKIDVGGEVLSLGTAPSPLGEEIDAGLFRSTRPGNIALDPVARFSPEGTVPYGYYRAGADQQVELHQLGKLAGSEHQRLNPGFEDGEGQLAFDPGTEPFGIYVLAGGNTHHSENTRNRDFTPPASTGKKRTRDATPPPQQTATVAHAARVFPLKSRDGNPVPNAYLLAFEEGNDGDYQDHVFVLWNVAPVAGSH